MNRLKVWCAYLGYAVLFAIVFVILLCTLTTAFLCIPTGIFLGLVGGAMLLFKTEFVLTELAPQILLYGGIFVASLSAFVALLAVKLGILAARIFEKVRRHCDRLRGWCS